MERAAAAAPVDEPTGTSSDPLALLRSQLSALGTPGAAVIVSGAVEVYEVLDSVESLTDQCPGCTALIFGAPVGIETDNPTQIEHRFWKGTTVVSITAMGAAIEQPLSEVRVSVNAGGKVFFGRECTVTMERTEHSLYSAVLDGTAQRLLEVKSFAGRLECPLLTNSTTGDAISLTAVFSWAVPDLGH